MEQIASDHDLIFSTVDISFFTRLEGHELFQYDNCASQLESAGICVEIPLKTAMPDAPDNAWTFRYGPKERRVVLIPERLSALGFSVVSWIFNPREEHKKLFMLLLKAVSFRNCLIEKLVPREGRTGDGKKVAVPLGWLYLLGVQAEFQLHHGEYGDFAIFIGTLPSIRSSGVQQESPASIVPQGPSDTKKGEELEKLEREEHQTSLSDHIAFEISTPTCNATEKLYLGRSKQLIYDQVSSRKQGISNLNIGPRAVGVEVECPERESEEVTAFPVPINSLSHFVGMEMKGSAYGVLPARMEKLRQVLVKEGLFPEGENQSFLKYFTGDAHKSGERTKIFHFSDCRVQKKHLKQHNVREDQLNPSEHVYFRYNCHGREGFRVKCTAVGSGLWALSGPREDATSPTKTIVLTRDLG